MISQKIKTPLELSDRQKPTAQELTTYIISYMGEKARVCSIIPSSIFRFYVWQGEEVQAGKPRYGLMMWRGLYNEQS